MEIIILFILNKKMELKNYKHLLVNTSKKNIEECARDCFEYVSAEIK